jgi:O-succinylbenzoate synthase
VGLAAGVALAAALPDLPYACGLGTLSLLEGDVVRDPLRPVAGEIEVRRPALDEETLRRWEVPAGGWRDRALAAQKHLDGAPVIGAAP